MRSELFPRSIFARRVHRPRQQVPESMRVDGCEHNISLEQTAREIACGVDREGDVLRWPSSREEPTRADRPIWSVSADNFPRAGSRGRLLSSVVKRP